MTTAQLLESAVVRAFRAEGAEPNAMDLRAACIAAAPEFDRIMLAGQEPKIVVDGPPLSIRVR